MNVNEKIQLLRKHMKKHGLDAYIIPSSDPHLSEYVADHWKARAWISGLAGGHVCRYNGRKRLVDRRQIFHPG